MPSETTTSDSEVIKEFTRIYDLNPDDVIIMGEEDVKPIGDFSGIDWSLKPGKTGISSGFLREVGDTVTITIVGRPDDISYQMGIKDPNEHMRYEEGKGSMKHDFPIMIKGKYYFFVTNLDSSRELQIKGTVIE